MFWLCSILSPCTFCVCSVYVSFTFCLPSSPPSVYLPSEFSLCFIYVAYTFRLCSPPQFRKNAKHILSLESLRWLFLLFGFLRRLSQHSNITEAWQSSVQWIWNWTAEQSSENWTLVIKIGWIFIFSDWIVGPKEPWEAIVICCTFRGNAIIC